jgi:hypothetical protein
MTPPLARADLERLLRLGLSVRQAAGALRVHLGAALDALEGLESLAAPAAPQRRLRRSVVRRGKPVEVEGAASGNGKARAIAAG